MGDSMNTLGYAILSALGRKPCSGYELVQYLDALWPAKHSQIYPRLTRMEENGHLVYEQIEQIGKPNKKIYSITEKGRETLESWITETPSSSIVRDEFLIKINSVWLSDEESAKKLIHERIVNLERNISLRATVIDEIEPKQEVTMTKDFGRFLLLNRRNMLEKEEISWCRWVLQLLEKINSNVNQLLIVLVGAGNLNIIF